MKNILKMITLLSLVIIVTACGVNSRTDFIERKYGEHEVKNHLDFDKKEEESTEAQRHKGTEETSNTVISTEAEKSIPEENLVSKEIAEAGDTVQVLYKGTLDDGEVFDSNTEKNPLTFKVAAGQMIPGFDKAVEGMKVNESKTIHIESKDAYGERSEDKKIDLPKEQVPSDIELKEGQIVPLTDPSGQTIQAKIIGFTADSISFDLNHPLAGEDLNFEITLLRVEGEEKL